LEKAEGTMSERAKSLDEEVLANFKESFARRYERWKRKDVLSIALQTMPKQVNAEKVIDNLVKMKAESARTLNCES
jgi:hypothetical protein